LRRDVGLLRKGRFGNNRYAQGTDE